MAFNPTTSATLRWDQTPTVEPGMVRRGSPPRRSRAAGCRQPRQQRGKHGDGTVRVSIRGVADSVILEVHNGGAPIPADKMDHLFEPFYPGGRRREGLGLYIVDQIVRSHQGEVSAESNEAKGTTFIVHWPRHAGPEGRTSSANASRRCDLAAGLLLSSALTARRDPDVQSPRIWKPFLVRPSGRAGIAYDRIRLPVS